ncbi:MAG: DUF3179 domain-containing protein [Bacteroidota bacterium]
MRRSLLALFLLSPFVLAACDSGADSDVNTDECTIDERLFRDGGVGKDGIPALTNPEFVAPASATYLEGNNRVIGIVIDGQALAVPHNILWFHEIVNLDRGGQQLAITYCPLTGTSMTFDRAPIDGGELGVSGLLFQSNLTMYDRNTQESLWPQMNREAGCGERAGQILPMVATVETTWDGWQAMHPNTLVLSESTGHSRNYRTNGYPYGNYEVPSNRSLLVSLPIDDRRLPKERLLGIADGTGGIALPFDELDRGGAVNAVEVNVGGEPMVVFWDRSLQGAMAYRPGGRQFEVADGTIRDQQTGSTWRFDGQAVAGAQAGQQLEQVAEAYVAFWFAWAIFQPESTLWDAGV